MFSTCGVSEDVEVELELESQNYYLYKKAEGMRYVDRTRAESSRNGPKRFLSMTFSYA